MTPNNNFDTAELEKMYRRAEERITAKLTDPNINYFQQSQKRAILVQIKRTLAELEKPTRRYLDKTVLKEFLDSWNLSVNILKKKPNYKNDFLPVVNERSVRSLVRSAMDEVRQVLANSYLSLERQLNNLDRELRDEIIRETGTTIITGESRQKHIQRMRSFLESQGITGFTYQTKPSRKNPNGLIVNQKLDAYVKGLARSTRRQASHDGVVQAAIKFDHDLVKGSNHGDPSPMCAPYQGKIFSISGKDKRYPKLSFVETWYNGRIGFGNHKWCRHTYSIYIPDEDIEFDRT